MKWKGKIIVNVLGSIRVLVSWMWRCARAWLEVGHRISDIELELQRQTNARTREIEKLERAIEVAVETERTGLEQVRRRLTDLERQQSRQVANLDRTLQLRVDEWARQLSMQMTELYSAVARSPIEVRKR